MLDFPNAPALNQVFVSWQWDGAKWMPYGGGVPPVPIAFPFAGKPAAGALVNVPMTIPMVAPASLAGATVYVSTQAAANSVFTINKISAGVTTPLGTVTITPTSHTSCTLAGAGGTLLAGDDLQVVAPAVQDATLADVGLTILMTRL